MSNRSRILVDPTVQWAIARRILLHWFLLVVCVTVITAMVRLLMGAGQQPFGVSLKAAFTEQMPMLLVMFILMPMFLRDTLKLSNRFTGPMYRLRDVLSNMAGGGDGYAVKFRDGDYWMDAATDFNTVLEQLNDLKARNEALEAELAEAKQPA